MFQDESAGFDGTRVAWIDDERYLVFADGVVNLKDFVGMKYNSDRTAATVILAALDPPAINSERETLALTLKTFPMPSQSQALPA